MLRYRGEAPPSPTVSPTVPARNKRVARPVNTGPSSTVTQSSASITSNLQTALHTAPVLQPAPQHNGVLSATATWLIAICALLLALAIALYARALPISLPASARAVVLDTQ